MKIPTRAAAITPSDTVDMANPTKSVYIGVGGDMKVTMKDGGTVIFVGLVTGSTKVGAFSRIWAADTDATNLIAEW